MGKQMVERGLNPYFFVRKLLLNSIFRMDLTQHLRKEVLLFTLYKMQRIKHTIFILLTFAHQGSLLAQNDSAYNEIKELAQKQAAAKEYALSFATYSTVINMYGDGFSKTEMYNAACIAALAGKKKKAIEWLQKALQQGFEDADHLQKDPDFYSIHGLKEWKEIVAESQKIKKAYDEKQQFVQEVTTRLLEGEGEALYKASSQRLKTKYPQPLFEGLVKRISKEGKEKNIRPDNTVMSNEERVNNVLRNSYMGIECFSFTIPIVQIPQSWPLRPIGNDVIIGVKFIHNEWRLDSLHYRLNRQAIDLVHLLDDVKVYKSSSILCSLTGKNEHGMSLWCPEGILEDLRTSFKTNTFTELSKVPDLSGSDSCLMAIRIEATNIYPLNERTVQVVFLKNSGCLLVSDENSYALFKSDKANEMGKRYKGLMREKMLLDFFR